MTVAMTLHVYKTTVSYLSHFYLTYSIATKMVQSQGFNYKTIRKIFNQYQFSLFLSYLSPHNNCTVTLPCLEHFVAV